MDLGDLKMNVGNRIATLRKKKKITQEELAKQLFASDKTISSWEANRTEPNLEMLLKISELLDCNVGYLIYGEEPKGAIETEIKIKLTKKEYQELELFLEENGRFINESRQIDTYYELSHRRFIKDEFEKRISIQEWLRIGIRGNKKILNYKNWYDNKYCDEYEVEIDNEKNLEKIFKVLGLEKIIVVDKIRKKYMYEKKFEIVLDKVEELGYYV